MSTTDTFIGLREAAQLAGVTPETVRKWADSGRITAGSDPEVLSRMNHGKQGRPHERYYSLEQVQHVSGDRRPTVEPDPALHMTLSEVEKTLGVAPRTLARLRAKFDPTEYVSVGSNQVYLLRTDVDAMAAKLRAK